MSFKKRKITQITLTGNNNNEDDVKPGSSSPSRLESSATTASEEESNLKTKYEEEDDDDSTTLSRLDRMRDKLASKPASAGGLEMQSLDELLRSQFEAEKAKRAKKENSLTDARFSAASRDEAKLLEELRERERQRFIKTRVQQQHPDERTPAE